MPLSETPAAAAIANQLFLMADYIQAVIIYGWDRYNTK